MVVTALVPELVQERVQVSMAGFQTSFHGRAVAVSLTAEVVDAIADCPSPSSSIRGHIDDPFGSATPNWRHAWRIPCHLRNLVSTLPSSPSFSAHHH